MFASDVLNRGAAGPRRQRTDRRGGDRRTRSRLRELCDEVLASYRLAQGQDVLSSEERESAVEVLRNLTPSVVR
jgi:hypothetical protein